MEHDVRAIIGAIGRSHVGCEPIWLPSGTHVMGTCRMGENTAESVVDLDGRVHGTDGLWLASVGLIPTRFAVNPTLTGAALAVRIASTIGA